MSAQEWPYYPIHCQYEGWSRAEMHKRVQTNGHMRMFTMLLSNWGHSRC